jgi:hypothetical protein
LFIKRLLLDDNNTEFFCHSLIVKRRYWLFGPISTIVLQGEFLKKGGINYYFKLKGSFKINIKKHNCFIILNLKSFFGNALPTEHFLACLIYSLLNLPEKKQKQLIKSIDKETLVNLSFCSYQEINSKVLKALN